jgi:mono/diheme cytochrome c family protein
MHRTERRLVRIPHGTTLLISAILAVWGAAVSSGRHVQAAAAGSTAQQGGPPASLDSKTIWDGVLTSEQAARGKERYEKACASCHKADLLGESAAPPLVGSQFVDRWVGSNLDDLVTTIRRSMPQDAPDSLGTAGYVDIVGYLLTVNGSPAGSRELPLEPEALKQILFTRQ